MHFKQLKYLEAAVRFGSLRQAAAQMGVAQPSLTQQIQRLEEELNVVLLVRRHNGVTLTDAGVALLPHVRLALQAEEGLHQQASAISGLHTGRLRLGTVPTASEKFVPQAVRKFQLAYPRIYFDVMEAGSGQIREALLSGELDLGVLARWQAGPDEVDGLRLEDLFDAQYSICVPKGHRLDGRASVDISDLAGEAFIVVHHGHVLRELFDQIAQMVDVTAIYHTNTNEAARRTVDAGIGISIQATMGWHHDSEFSSSIPLNAPWPQGALSIARRSNEQPTPAMTVFMKLLRDVAAEMRSAQR